MPVMANVGIPMLMLTLPFSVLALIPVVLIEAAFGRRMLALSWPQAIKIYGRANLHSTFWGVPLTWLLLLAVEMVLGMTLGSMLSDVELSKQAIFVLQIIGSPISAWIGPGEPWDVYIAYVGLSIPFCVASVLIEEWSIRREVSMIPYKSIRSSLVWGNVSSYVFLCVGFLIFPLNNS